MHSLKYFEASVIKKQDDMRVTVQYLWDYVTIVNTVTTFQDGCKHVELP